MHDLEFRNNKYSFAFTGRRDQIWHRLGNELPENATRKQWIDASGMGHSVIKVPAPCVLPPEMFPHLTPEQLVQHTGRVYIVRADTGEYLGFASEGYNEVQPSELWDWFERYISVDDRFKIDAAGVLHSGQVIWISARFQCEQVVAGERHNARIVMSTSYDLTQPTRNQASMTRPVCRNTINMVWADRNGVVTTRHSTKFNPNQVAKELGQLCQSFDTYKLMGDALANVVLAEEDVNRFFAELLEIDPKVNLKEKTEDISTRKFNQYEALQTAFYTTQDERNTTARDGWTALQAVTRYVDHSRSTRNADNEIVGRFEAGTFGSGDALKGRAMGLLMPLIKDKVAIPA